jgi:hypothetical protein
MSEDAGAAGLFDHHTVASIAGTRRGTATAFCAAGIAIDTPTPERLNGASISDPLP